MQNIRAEKALSVPKSTQKQQRDDKVCLCPFSVSFVTLELCICQFKIMFTKVRKNKKAFYLKRQRKTANWALPVRRWLH